MKPMRRLFLSALLFFSLIPVSLFAQGEILHEKVDADTTEDLFGPGRRHYLHPFASYGAAVALPEGPGASTRLWGSGLFDIGLRYKLKILKRWEMGVGVKYERSAYGLEQDDDKEVFGPTQHEQEKLILNDLSGDLYTRFVFGKRGDFVGTFLDLGAYLDHSFRKQHMTVDEYEDPNAVGAEEVKSKQRGLTYVEDLHYGFLARFGRSRYVLFARYRFSDLFKGDGIAADYPELPRLQVGVQLGMHR